jgi:hypothetical protein
MPALPRVLRKYFQGMPGNTGFSNTVNAKILKGISIKTETT